MKKKQLTLKARLHVLITRMTIFIQRCDNYVGACRR